MDNEVIHSRPKIHRLPPNIVEESGLYISRTTLLILLALLVAAGIPALWSVYKRPHEVASARTQKQMAVSVNNPYDSMVVRNESDEIVGQIAQMPMGANPETYIQDSKQTNAIKQNEHKELLAIISRN